MAFRKRITITGSARSGLLASFIKILKMQEGVIDEFDERLWSSVVDFVTIGRNKEMTVIFREGTEVQI